MFGLSIIRTESNDKFIEPIDKHCYHCNSPLPEEFVTDRKRNYCQFCSITMRKKQLKRNSKYRELDKIILNMGLK